MSLSKWRRSTFVDLRHLVVDQQEVFSFLYGSIFFTGDNLFHTGAAYSAGETKLNKHFCVVVLVCYQSANVERALEVKSLIVIFVWVTDLLTSALPL